MNEIYLFLGGLSLLWWWAASRALRSSACSGSSLSFLVLCAAPPPRSKKWKEMKSLFYFLFHQFLNSFHILSLFNPFSCSFHAVFALLHKKINYCLNILSQQANQTKREGWVPSLCWLLWWRVGWLPSFGWLAPFFWWNQMKERTGPAKEEQSTRAPAAIERGEANELSEWVEWNSSQFIAERVMGAAAPFLLSFHSINQWNSRQINFLYLRQKSQLSWLFSSPGQNQMKAREMKRKQRMEWICWSGVRPR